MEQEIEIKEKKRFNFKFWFSGKGFKILKFIIVLVIVIASSIIIKDEVFWQLSSDSSTGDNLSEDSTAQETGDSVDQEEEDNCNVSGINFHGDLYTYIPASDYGADGNLMYDEVGAENLTYYIEEAEKNNNIKAIILEIDSRGGSPVAGEEIANVLRRVQKPTVALIRESGTSAAYYAATGADRIFASVNSDVGSIGVTMSYLDNSLQNQKEGLTYNQLSVGKYKDAGDPDRKLTTEEIAIFMRDLDIIHQNFIKAVAENRNLDINKVKALADGSSMLGEAALKNGLIDEIGDINSVKEYLKEKIGADIEICW